MLVVWLCLSNGLDRDILLAKWTCRVILEPVFDAALVKVMLEVAGQRDNILLRLKFTEANAALVKVRELFGTPLHSEHLF